MWGGRHPQHLPLLPQGGPLQPAKRVGQSERQPGVGGESTWGRQAVSSGESACDREPGRPSERGKERPRPRLLPRAVGSHRLTACPLFLSNFQAFALLGRQRGLESQCQDIWATAKKINKFPSYLRKRRNTEISTQGQRLQFTSFIGTQKHCLWDHVLQRLCGKADPDSVCNPVSQGHNWKKGLPLRTSFFPQMPVSQTRSR